MDEKIGQMRADVALITSLYRSEAHLPTYIDHAKAVTHQVTAAGLRLALVLVANDATPNERQRLEIFAHEMEDVRVLHVERESLYASWNRGVATANADLLGFWNVDDVRNADALIEGVGRLRAGCPLVYFSHEVIRTATNTRRAHTRRIYPAVPFDPDVHRRLMKCGPFFLFRRDLYAQMGGFDERFRIAGDFDWCARATDHAAFCPVDMVGGTFMLHGGNLSDTGDPLQVAEINIVHLKRGAYQYLTPADPELMQATWAKWAADYPLLPEEVAERLWGRGAAAWRRRWQRERQRKQVETTLRYLPKTFIDRAGLRPMLARWGVVKARKPSL